MSLTDTSPTVLHVGRVETPEPFDSLAVEEVLRAGDAEDALATNAEQPIDCVVVDADASAAARRVRERDATIPLVVRTDAAPVTVAAAGDWRGRRTPKLPSNDASRRRSARPTTATRPSSSTRSATASTRSTPTSGFAPSTGRSPG